MKEIISQNDNSEIEIDYEHLDDNGEPIVAEVEEINGEYVYKNPTNIKVVSSE